MFDFDLIIQFLEVFACELYFIYVLIIYFSFFGSNEILWEIYAASAFSAAATRGATSWNKK